MPKGEFENRERDEVAGLGDIPLSGSLGELPDDIANERGDLDTYSTKGLGSRFPDMVRAQESRVESRDTGIGSPMLDYTVRSIYDSRPTSAFDFNLWFGKAPVEAAFSLADYVRCFSVPAGYVAVLREVKILVTAQASDLRPFDGTLRVLIDGTVRDPINVKLITSPTTLTIQQEDIPFRDDESVKVFQIADEFQFIGVDLDIPDFDYANADGDELRIGFFGNFLLKTGRPAMFEPANLGGKSKHAVTSSPREIASGSDLVQRRRRKRPFDHVPILRK